MCARQVVVQHLVCDTSAASAGKCVRCAHGEGFVLRGETTRSGTRHSPNLQSLSPYGLLIHVIRASLPSQSSCFPGHREISRRPTSLRMARIARQRPDVQAPHTMIAEATAAKKVTQNLEPCAGALGKFERSLGCVSVDCIPFVCLVCPQMYLHFSSRKIPF